jgi:protein-disulfide isomerase
MHDLLIEHQGELDPKNLIRDATQLGLDVKSFTEDLKNHRWNERVAADVESADVSGVAGTPTFFVNGQRQMGVFDLATLSRAVRTARAQADIGHPGQ